MYIYIDIDIDIYVYISVGQVQQLLTCCLRENKLLAPKEFAVRTLHRRGYLSMYRYTCIYKYIQICGAFAASAHLLFAREKTTRASRAQCT